MRIVGIELGIDCMNWSVIHVPTAKALRNVLWADDDTAEYCVTDMSAGRPVDHVCLASKILILVDRKLVLIDPVEDDSDVELRNVEAVAS